MDFFQFALDFVFSANSYIGIALGAFFGPFFIRSARRLYERAREQF